MPDILEALRRGTLRCLARAARRATAETMARSARAGDIDRALARDTENDMAYHPAIEHFAGLFAFAHLPPHLREVSRGFHDLAKSLVDNPGLSGPELTVALRKLLEAKDSAVRAALDSSASWADAPAD